MRKAWTLLSAAAFLALAVVHAERVNLDLGKYDQDSYLRFAIAESESHFTVLGSRRQMPIYPMLQSLFYAPGTSIETFFARAKLVNVGLSAAVALGLWFLLVRLLPKNEARNVALVSIFFVLAFRAPYVQAEVLSYACIFALFLLFCRLWKRPSLPLALGAGALLAFGFFVKATALLGGYVFVACFAIREIWRLVRERAVAASLRRLTVGLATVLTFAALVAPYARTSKALYGSYLYDMNTRYVMWCDSWQEFQELYLRFGPHDRWRDLPPEELPSMSKYVADHSIGQMIGRELRGLAEVVGNCVISHGYAPFFVILIAFVAAMLHANPGLRAVVVRPRDPQWLGWFVVPYFAVHLFTLGFYGPLGANERFSLTMFLPAMYAATRALSGRAGPEHVVRIGALELDWGRFHAAYFAVVVVMLVSYWPVAMATVYSGG
jgi:hypothetical protein